MSTRAFVPAVKASGLKRRHVLVALVTSSGLVRTPWAQAQATSSAELPLISVQLARIWPATRSPQGFGVSEKLDGVRAVWDGQALRFRSGRHIAAPSWFVAALPSLALDGELWMARGAFDRLSGVVRQSVPNDDAWREVQYWIFDTPRHPGTFSERVGLVQSVLAAAPVPWLKPVAQHEVKDARALQTLLQETVRQGGEGLMLHRADALWQDGRTDALFKFKPEPDEEAQVLGYLPGQGRHAGLTGALLVRNAAGIRFALGSGLSDAMRREPPAIGSWVTYRHRGHTPGGVPRFATFLRDRPAE
jgi:DNA ligase-1